MPELPEVETVVRTLARRLVGRTIAAVRFGRTDFVENPAALRDRLPGARITAIRRLGKFILLSLQPSLPTGTPLHLIIHLGMTGRLYVCGAGAPPLPHTHAFLSLDDGCELRYTDARRFGRMFLIPDAATAAFAARLGDDPLEIKPAAFRRRLGQRRARIKALLLDQRVLRGVGNIYADESLWRARLHPMRVASSLAPRELERLRRALQTVLRAAIRFRGSSISDFVDGNGNPGAYQRRHRVYQREASPCPRCRSAIRRVVVAGRSSFFCPACQPAPRLRQGLNARRSLASPRRRVVPIRPASRRAAVSHPPAVGAGRRRPRSV